MVRYCFDNQLFTANDTSSIDMLGNAATSVDRVISETPAHFNVNDILKLISIVDY